MHTTLGNITIDKMVRENERDELLREALNLCGQDPECTLVTLSADDKDGGSEVHQIHLCRMFKSTCLYHDVLLLLLHCCAAPVAVFYCARMFKSTCLYHAVLLLLLRCCAAHVAVFYCARIFKMLCLFHAFSAHLFY